MNPAQTWPRRRLAEALAAIARHGGLIQREPDSLPATPDSFDSADTIPRWLDTACEWLDVEVDPIGLPHGAIASTLEGAAPALVSVGEDAYVAIVRRGRRGTVWLVGPDGAIERTETGRIADAIEHHALVHSRAPIEPLRALLRTTETSDAERRRMEQALIGELLTRLPPSERCWSLRPPAGASALARLVRLGGHRHALWTLGAHVLSTVLMLAAWAILGHGILSGRDDPGWRWAWALMILSTVPLAGILAWAKGRLTIGIGALLRERLLEGSLRFDRHLIQRDGVGTQLGRVMEAENLDGAALGGGLATLLALSEFMAVIWLLTQGSTGTLHALLAVGWLVAVGILVVRLHRAHREWVRRRLLRTAESFERMVGHRTRLAQQDPAHMHDGEDPALTAYLDAKRRVDRRSIILDGVLGRAWVLTSMALVLASYVEPEASLAGVGIAMGATVLGGHALAGVSRGISLLVGASVAWLDARPFFDAAAASRLEGIPNLAASLHREDPSLDDGAPLLEAHDLDFRYDDHRAFALEGCTTTIESGDRVLLQGPSGSGKSTLVSLLAGLHEPQAGLILLRGLDRRTVGTTTWRRRVIAVPQFHENHLTSNTLAFNLLMGRRWPPTPTDLHDARSVCEGLGLGALLERMPAGMQQVVGETGWQLSHGERSRVFIARALLQQPDCVIFDESFGALDPENLANTMSYALQRAKTAIVIAHP